MKDAMKLLFGIRCKTKRLLIGVITLAGAATFLVGCSERGPQARSGSAQRLLLKGFDGAGVDEGWEIKNFEMESKSPSISDGEPLAEGTFWQSPPFPMKPRHYFRIEVQSKGGQAAWIGGMGFNPSATWGRYPHPGAIAGELVADDWTSWGDTSDSAWTKRVFFTRALGHSTKCGVRLMGSGVVFQNLLVTTATREEVCAWADEIYMQDMPKLAWVPSVDVMRSCPRARKILADGKPLRMAFVGDSIINDMANSTIDLLLERAFPGSIIEIINAVGGGTGAGAWLNDAATAWPKHDLDLRAAVIQPLPDLVIIGGISNGSSWHADITGLVARVQQEAQTSSGSKPEILIASGAFGTGPDTPEPSMTKLASELGCGFLPLRSITEDYFQKAAAQQYSRSHFHRDPIHANHRGKQLLGRILLKFFEGSSESSK